MRRWTVASSVVCATLLAATAAHGQQNRSQAVGAALSEMDYVELRQLVARYGWAMDSGGDNGYAFADLFAEDGELVRPAAKGREQLAAVARGGKRGPMFVSHYGMNHVIEPSPQGATGKQYVVEINIDDPGSGQRGQAPNAPGKGARGQSARGQAAPAVDQWALVGRKGGELSPVAGRYDDVYVRTPGGWRFKSREFIASRSGPRTGSAPRPVVGETAKSPIATVQPGKRALSTLTALDYIEIERLVASYGHALDSGFGGEDNGPAYAGLFAEGGIFYSRGRPYQGEQLIALARAQPHGPQYVRHFLTNHVIEPSAEGATGKQYLVVIDVGENGKPSSIFLGGHYQDVYVKTPQGWLFKTRRSFGSSSGPQPAQAGTPR